MHLRIRAVVGRPRRRESISAGNARQCDPVQIEVIARMVASRRPDEEPGGGRSGFSRRERRGRRGFDAHVALGMRLNANRAVRQPDHL
jgi:hypothetical protein